MTLQTLLHYENEWPTTMGKAFPTERVVFRGCDLHNDLNDMDWFELNLYGITGRRFSETELKVLNYIWVSTSYPDPRIWNNRISALAGTVRTNAAAAISASIAASDATIYGGRPFVKGIQFLSEAKQAWETGEDIETFIDAKLESGETIYCFGRAMVKGDERVPHMLVFLKEQKLFQSSSVQIAIEIEELLKRKKGLVMNISALYCAVALELGFSAKEFHLFMTLVFSAGMAPCYLEASERPMGAFFPVRCSQLIYRGSKPRRKLNQQSEASQESGPSGVELPQLKTNQVKVHETV